MGTAILGNLILLVIFGAVFLRILTFIIGIVRNVFNYYFSFSGVGYFIMHSKKTEVDVGKRRNRTMSRIRSNPGTGLPMESIAHDISGNIYGFGSSGWRDSDK